MLGFLWFLLSLSFAAPVHLLQLQGGVDPGSADYIIQGISKAEQEKAEAVLIELDTPGGLLESTRKIVQKQLNAKVPVIVYVGPQGARAGSAGVFMTMAAHVAAMAPATTIGAAHPVNLMGSDEKTQDTPMQDKILNDTVSWAKAIAKQRKRNADWAEKAVRDSVSVDAEEALKLKVIDVVSASRQELLADLHGKQLQTASGLRTLHTKGVPIISQEMGTRQQLMHFLGDPNIIFFMLTVGALCLYTEFKSPGLIFPAVIGIIFLISAGIGLSIVPFHLGGLFIVLIGIAAVIAEAYTSGFGMWAGAGAVLLMLGGALMFQVQGSDLRIGWIYLVSTGGTVALAGGLLGYFATNAMSRKVQLGSEGLIDMRAVVIKGGSGGGRVRVQGEDWAADWFGVLQVGQEVRVSAVAGLRLKVDIIAKQDTKSVE